MREFIKGGLKSRLAANNVNIKVMASETMGWDPTYSDIILGDPDASSRLDIVAAHHYGQNGDQNFSNANTAGKPIWLTETSLFTTPEPRSQNMSITDGLYWANQIHDTFTQANASAFNWWWMWKDATELDPNGNETNEELVTLDRSLPDGQQVVLHKRLFAIGQFSKFIRPGYVRLNSTTWSDGVSLTAYKDPNAPSQLIIVAINNNSTSKSLNVSLNGVSCTDAAVYRTSDTENLQNVGSININGSSFTNDLKANSVTTFVANVGTSQQGPTGYTYCQPENGTQYFSSPVDVAYGANGSYNYKYGVTGNITFNNDTFGDPCQGVVKSGYYKISSDTNIALNKYAFAFSSWDAVGTAPSKGVDNNTGTIWASNGTEANPLYEVDLGSAFTLSKIELVARQDMDQSGARTNFEIRASNNVDFSLGYVVLGSQGTSPFPVYGTWSSTVTDSNAYRYIQVARTNNAGHFNFSELRVFGH